MVTKGRSGRRHAKPLEILIWGLLGFALSCKADSVPKRVGAAASRSTGPSRGIERPTENPSEAGRKAQQLLLRADQRLQEGDFRAAAVSQEGAVALFAEARDSRAEAIAALRSAVLAHRLGDLRLSEQMFRRAIARARDLSGRRGSETPDGALPSERLAGALFEEAGISGNPGQEPDSVARNLESLAHVDLGRLLSELRRYPESEKEIVGALSNPALAPSLVALAHDVLGQSAAEMKNLPAAAKHFEISLDRLGGRACAPRSGRLREVCITDLSARGEVEAAMGNRDGALSWNQSALDAAVRFKDPVMQLYVLAKRSSLLPVDALNERKAIFDTARTTLATIPSSPERATALLHSSAIALGALEAEAALTYVAEARQRLASRWTPELGCFLGTIEAAAKTMLGDFEGVQVAADETRQCPGGGRLTPLEGTADAFDEQRSSEDAGGQGMDSAALVRIVENLNLDPRSKTKLKGMLRSLFNPGSRAANPRVLGEAMRLLYPNGARGFEMQARADEMARALEEGRGDQLYPVLNAMLDTPGAQTGGTVRWIRQLMADLLLQMSDTGAALSLATARANADEKVLKGIRLDHHSRLLLDNLQADLEVLVALRVKRRDFSGAFVEAERARAFSSMRWLGRSQPDPKEGADPDLLKRLEAAKQEIRRLEGREPSFAAEGREQNADLQLARRRYDDLLVRLKLSQPGYSELAAAVTVDLAQVQRALPPQACLVSYFTLPDKALVWVVDSERWTMAELPIDRAELARRVKEFRAAIANIGAEQRRRGVVVVDGVEVASAANMGRLLFRELIAPIQRQVRHRRLLVVPHDSLHQLPFAAIFDEPKNSYLGQEYLLSFLPSAGALSVWSRPAVGGEKRPLILGDPKTRRTALPSARTEALRVASILRTTALVGESATESEVRNAASSLTLLHLAAHGVLDEREPRQSYIALAHDSAEDGRLKVGEIFDELRLTKRPIVVLSACQSGMGQRSGGDEVEGLIRAFLYAGAGSVMATLWSIDDDASELLIEKFYENLAAGRPTADALHRAQGALIANPRFRSPYYWAGFVLNGDPEI